MASVLLALIRPAATLVIVRSAPTSPTLTVLLGAVPAKIYWVPLRVVSVVATAAPVLEPAPRATSSAWVVDELEPKAILRIPKVLAASPKAREPASDVLEPLPNATDPCPIALLPLPNTTAPFAADEPSALPAATLLAPRATAPFPLTVFGSPIATAPSPFAC